MAANTITREEALAKMNEATAKGRVFGVTFTKKDGSERKMQCKLKIAAEKCGIKGKGMAYKPAERQLLPVTDMVLWNSLTQAERENGKAFRMVNLATVNELRTAGETFNVS